MNRLSRTFAVASLALLVVDAGGCRKGESPTPAVPSPSRADARAGPASQPGTPELPARSTTRYPLRGVVKRVTPDADQVLIAHEAIPGLMGAMTMPFRVKDKDLLRELHEGDGVEGTLRVDREGETVGDYALEGLAVTRPALATPPPSRRLVFSESGIESREAPKRLVPGDEVPDFAMTTQEGKALRLSELRGKVVVLTFIYTRCPLPDFCPLMDRKFAALADKLSASPERSDRVRLLSVSFDPEHDTPAVLTQHARIQGGRTPLWTFAVAAHPELAKVAAPLGLTYGPMATEIVHNLCTVVIDPDGRLARLAVGGDSKRWSATELFQFVAKRAEAAPR